MKTNNVDISSKEITLKESNIQKQPMRGQADLQIKEILIRKTCVKKLLKSGKRDLQIRETVIEKGYLKKLLKNEKRELKLREPVIEMRSLKQFLMDKTKVVPNPIHEQKQAQNNMNIFHKSDEFSVCQCTMCFEAWPLKSSPRRANHYQCQRCTRDKQQPKKFSKENDMLPSLVPLQLLGLTHVEEMLIARALPITHVYIKPGGQKGYSGHVQFASEYS